MPSALTILAFTTFIANNPGFVAVLIGALFSIISALLVVFWQVLSKQIGGLQATDDKVIKRLEDAERLLEKVQSSMENRVADLGSISEDIRELHTLVHRQGVENMAAHAAITERLVRVETKMPNGELQEALQLLRELVRNR